MAYISDALVKETARQERQSGSRDKNQENLARPTQESAAVLCVADANFYFVLRIIIMILSRYIAFNFKLDLYIEIRPLIRRKKKGFVLPYLNDPVAPNYEKWAWGSVSDNSRPNTTFL